jgi:uncharacterized membrane protein
VPASVDYQPILPWFGMVLAGLCLGRWITTSPPALLRHAPQNPLGRLLQFGGQHSLLVYLFHQPIFFGLLFVLAQALGVHPDGPNEETGFARACEAQCRESGGSDKVCPRACACVIDGLRQANLWSQALSNQVDPAVQDRLDAIATRCSGQQ